MYLLLNGAFGIGKTTVAQELRNLIAGAAIFNPEWIGMALQRLPGGRVDDFQDLPHWRRGTVWGARLAGVYSSSVIIPMTFSNPAYLDEVRDGLAATGRPVVHVCLVAPVEVVRARLAGRGEPVGDPRWAWVHRRADECCRAHQADRFQAHVLTDDRTPAAIAADVLAHVRNATRQPE